MSNIQEVTAEVVKSAPPLAVTGAMIMGISVSDWAAIVTIIYVSLQIFFLLRKQLKKEPKKPAVTDAR
ncbi:hypothetical protein NP572_19570 [Pseudomonas putida]|uniref:hypothetical protein n=1 Tax=Pseudomonas putida TaxID=303 RepID=UPI0023637BA7|nr:hypothetical protein [Pseudomonas putida]MDD2038737.1 hypothetical protein [Pseudomonas putida]MDD2044318.1 hypothetical protein [Pseudomonas putida]